MSFVLQTGRRIEEVEEEGRRVSVDDGNTDVRKEEK